MRQHQVLMEGAFPHELKAVFDAYEVQSNPWGLPADTRGKWANGLDVPVVQTADDMRALDYLFYVGSAESFDPRAQKIAVAFVRIMKHAGVRVGILGARETSTGECVRRAGNEMLFQQLARPARRHAQRAWRHPDRHLRSACVQHAAERVPGVRRPLRGRSPHAAHRPPPR
jgi:Fe-S oxidoreductase